MNKKSATLIAIAVLLIGAGIFFALRQSSAASDADKLAAAKGASEKGTAGHVSTATAPTAPPARSNRNRPPSALYPDLAQKYGESRTNLSRSVVDRAIGLLDQMAVMVDSAGDLSQAMGGNQRALGSLTQKLNLTEDQQAEAGKVIADYQKRQFAKLKTLSEALRDEPRPLVEMVLAGDARSRNQMSEEDYQSTAKTSMETLRTSAGGSISSMGDRDMLFNDPQAKAGFEKILDPTQAESFQQIAAEKPPVDPNKKDQLEKALPPVELEKLDQTLEQSGKMMEGMKQMIDGAKGLKNIQPPVAPAPPAQGE